MKIGVVGAGAIGTYYGGKLAAADRDVHFLVRTGYENVRTNGIHLTGPGEDVRLTRVNCHQSTNKIGVCDLVLVAVKTTSNGALPDLLPPLIGDKTLLMTLQNGLGNEEFLAQQFGSDRILAGLCFICLERKAPGVVHRSDYGHMSIGEYGRAPLDRTRAIAGLFQTSGIQCKLVGDLALERWRKLVWNIAFNGLSIAAGGVDTASILADPDLRASTLELMREVIGAANKCGFPLELSVADEYLHRTETMGHYKPSTLIDFEAGNPLEIEPIWGEPLRRAQIAGAEMPRLQQLYALLKSLNRGAEAE